MQAGEKIPSGDRHTHHPSVRIHSLPLISPCRATPPQPRRGCVAPWHHLRLGRAGGVPEGRTSPDAGILDEASRAEQKRRASVRWAGAVVALLPPFPSRTRD